MHIMFLMDFIKIFIVVQIGRLAVLILYQRRFNKRQKNANCEIIDYRVQTYKTVPLRTYSALLSTVLCRLISASCNAMLLHPPEDWLM